MSLAEIGFPGLVESVSQIGIIAALLCFFVWQSSKEKTVMSQRITDVENFQRDEMSGMVKETTTALANSNKAIEDNSRVMQKLCNKLDGVSDSDFRGMAPG